MNIEYHVSVNGCDRAEGSRENPFRTISRAAAIAETGDRVIVHEGVYREWVKPAHTGYSNISRITYEAAEGEKVVIKGSERIQNWEQTEGTVWKAVVPNTLFGDYNPYQEILGAVSYTHLIMEHFERAYDKFRETWDLTALLPAYHSYLLNKDARVRVLDPKGEFCGTARGINEAGELLVEKEDGELARVYAGEVSVRGVYGYV